MTMKKNKFLLLFLFAGLFFVSCSKSDVNDNPTDPNGELPGPEPTDNVDLEIKDFEWKGLNFWYLYKDDVSELADDYFANQSELNDWLATWDTPEKLFYDGLLYDYPNTDRFSWIVDDYTELEQALSGITKSTGMDYGLSYYPDSNEKVLGYVRYVLPNTPAKDAGVKRGMIFTEINGQQITVGNYKDLLSSDPFVITLGKLENGTVTTTDQTISLDKVVVEEDPVFIAKTIDVGTKKVGYLMYNGFYDEYDEELNNAFGDFKNAGVTDLVLDLRYNGGGSVATAVDLASMITGQFEGKVFIRSKYNSTITNIIGANSEDLVTRMDGFINDTDSDDSNDIAINSLKLNKVYIIGTGSTASASELVMNNLAPYIDVVHIGTTTVGKVQASTTLYDSTDPYFRKRGTLNPDHKYAMQPLILTSVNANGEAHPEGLTPDIEKKEYIDTFGTLGDPNEPLLAVALDQIGGGSGTTAMTRSMSREINGEIPARMFSENKAENPEYQKMYVENPLKNRE